MTRYYLGLDNGGTTTKAAIYDECGAEIGVCSVATEVNVPRPDFAERDMEEMWRANCRVIRGVIEKTGVRPEDIRAAAVCGHGKGLYLWGRDGRPARPGILSTDNRAYAYPEAWRKSGVEARLFDITCQHILPYQPTALLAWLRDNEPETVERTKYVFACKDYVRFRLTGEARAELTDYSGDGLVNLRTGAYDTRISAALGLSGIDALLPPLARSTEICGRVTRRAAEETGLVEGTAVAGGMFDIDACALAAGLADTEHVCMVAGTWSINELLLPEPVTDGRVLMNSMYCLPGYYLVEESSPTSAGNLAWYISELLPELERESAADGGSVYDSLNAMVASVGDGEFCPVFLPFLMASNVHPNARAAFVGLSAYHSRAHLTRSIYEGIAFSHRFHYEKLRRCIEREPESIRLAGGAARSRVWTQMFADVMQLPVETIKANETGALGAAIAAAAAVGDFAGINEAMSAMSAIGEPVEPNRASAGVFDRKYALYSGAIAALDPLWDDIQAFIEKK